ncbi:MAG: hypothetical protein ABIZ49_00555, partial [Opitutaceae bacterium]
MKKGCLIAIGSTAALMLLVIGGCIYIAEQYEKEHPELAIGSKALLAVEKEVIAYKGTAALGNSEQARAIAKQYSLAMRFARQAFFTGTDSSKMSLSQGQFITYCSLLPDRCTFIV